MRRNLKFLATAMGLMATTAAWGAVKAGDILLAQGAAFVRSASGAERAAAVGMAVESGETLVTRDGRLQVKFSDGGLTSLQPETQFTITNYQPAGDKNGESAIFKLLKGGFRTITGLIGRQNHSAYRVDTAVATIGIRGTEYQALLCSSSCKQPDGLYVHTGEGIIFVKNVAGEIDVGRGQSAFVGSADTAPQRTTATPPMTARAIVTSPPPVAGVGTNELAPGNILGANPGGAITSITGGGLALASSGTASGTFSSNFFSTENFSGTTSGAGSGAGSTNAIPAGTIAGVFMDGAAVTGAVMSANGGVASIVFGAPPVNTGSNGDLYWGRWTGTTMTMFAGLNGYVANASITIPVTSSIHYLLGTSVPTIPTTGSATFSFVGGTPSTDVAGGIGAGITSGTLTAYFNSNYVSGTFDVSHGANYAVSAFMPMGSNRTNFGTDHGGSASASAGAGALSAQVNGFFVGSGSPTGAGISYTIQTPNPIVGVGAFR